MNERRENKKVKKMEEECKGWDVLGEAGTQKRWKRVKGEGCEALGGEMKGGKEWEGKGCEEGRGC